MITKPQVEQVINEWTGRDIAFTAFDVTKLLRQNGESARHNQVNGFVKELYRNNEMWDSNGTNAYEATVVGLPNVSPAPFLYHPNGYDVTDYDPLWVEEVLDDEDDEYDGDDDVSSTEDLLDTIDDPIMINTQQISDSKKIVDSSNSMNSLAIAKVVTKRSDGRLNIPQSFISNSPTFNVLVLKNSIELFTPKPSSQNKGQLICRNKDGRIRLGTSILKKFSGSKFYVEKQSDKTIIYPSGV